MSLKQELYSIILHGRHDLAKTRAAFNKASGADNDIFALLAMRRWFFTTFSAFEETLEDVAAAEVTDEA